jgi:hypothetical protein
MLTTTAIARCPDCGRAVPTPPDASGPTTARCGRCGYVVGLVAPWRERAPTAAEATSTDAGAARRRWAWRG